MICAAVINLITSLIFTMNVFGLLDMRALSIDNKSTFWFLRFHHSFEHGKVNFGPPPKKIFPKGQKMLNFALKNLFLRVAKLD
jgi:hypothetical protein